MSVKWVMEMIDKVSPPAKNAAKSLDQVDKSVDKLAAHSKHAQGALSELGHHIDAANKKAGKEFLEGLAERFAVFNVGVSLAEKFFEKLVEIGTELGRDAVSAANFGRANHIVFNALLGGVEKGDEAVEFLEKFAISAGIGIEKSRDLVRALSLGGFEGKNLNVVMNAAVDVEALSGGRFQAQEFAEAFTNLQAKGELSSRMLMQFQSVLGEGGFDKLAKKLGFATHGFHALQQQLEATPVSAHRAEQAILDVIEEVSGGKLGATQAKLGKELPGLWQTITDRVHVLLGKVGESPAWEHLLSIFDRLGAALDPATDSGKAFESSLERMLVGVEDLLDRVSKPGAMNDFINGLTRFADAAATVANAVVAVTEGIADLIGWWSRVPEVVKVGLNPVGTFAGKLFDAASWIKGAHDEQAAYQGAKYFAEQKALGEHAGDGLKEGVASSLEIRSPSRVMYRLGEHAGEGLRQGVESSSTSSRGAPQLKVELTVVVQGGGDAEEHGRAVGRVALAELQPALDSLLEQLAAAS